MIRLFQIPDLDKSHKIAELEYGSILSNYEVLKFIQ